MTTSRLRWGWQVRFALLGWLLVRSALAAEPATETLPDPEGAPVKEQYLRVVRDEAGAGTSLDTAIVTLVPQEGRMKGVAIDLVAAIHIAEKSYYDELNRRLGDYDVVLYELVAPPEDRVPQPGRKTTNHPIGMLQNGMRNMLKLESQIDQIDYTPEHFVHADMSPEEMSRSMESRGESFMSMFMQMFRQGMARAEEGGLKVNDMDLVRALLDKNRSHTLKRLLADQFEDLDVVLGAMVGTDGSTIVTERNKIAVAEAVKQVEQGEQRIAILYGAAHMPDMEARLCEELALERGGVQWLPAWDLTDTKGEPVEVAKPKPAPVEVEL
jgi:hypothetical protein